MSRKLGLKLFGSLLYPLSSTGIVMVCFCTIASATLSGLGALLGGFAIALKPIGLLIGASYFWYLCECVRDSSDGNTISPSLLGNTDDLQAMIEQYFYIAICWGIFILPSILYIQFTKHADTVFYILTAYGVLCFPMAILRVILFDSLSALNPVGLIWSILKTIPFYLGLLLIIAAVTSPFIFILSRAGNSSFIGFISILFLSYISMVFAHLLGRFYYRYQNILKWDI